MATEAPSPPTLADVMTNVLNAVVAVLYQITKVIADNASVIATILVVGAVAFLAYRYGSRIFRGITGWLRALF
jgi:hypothetical protein